MLETNIRIVQFGADLRLDTRVAEVVTQDISADLLERACKVLLRRHGLPAVRFGSNRLLVHSRSVVPAETLEEENLRLELRDTVEVRRLCFGNRDDQNAMAQLLERCLIRQVSQAGLWRLDSYRIWYEKNPFKIVQDIAAYRRYEIGSIPIDGVGVGIVIDVSTAFFTTLTVADFFRNDVSREERNRLRRRFEQLTARQQEQKGTLLYELETGRRDKCYFDSFWDGVTAATTPSVRLNGVNYSSLQDYYSRKHGISVDADEPVAKVSFFGIDRPVPVSARRLRLRVMNDFVPARLKNVDKIEPACRHDMIEAFWARVGQKPFGNSLPGAQASFWRPPRERILDLDPPELVFGAGEKLSAPMTGTLSEYRKYYRDRMPLLDRVGCFHVPPTIPRVLHVAVPDQFGKNIAEQLGEAVSKCLARWTRVDITPEWFLYQTTDEAIHRLRSENRPGVALIIFSDDDPATYFRLSRELKEWRIKRITQATLQEYAEQFAFATDATSSGSVKVVREPHGWNSFIEKNALDVLQQVDCVPFALAEQGPYEAHLAIDVGQDHRHFSLSLLICRPDSERPFWFRSKLAIKADPKKETINHIHLKDEIVKLGNVARAAGFENIGSFLVLRDGRECGRELEAINSGCDELRSIEFLANTARVDVVDFHKRSIKGIRLWDVAPNGKRRHALEGKGIIVNDRVVVFVNTGAATLHQGTAEPVMIEAVTSAVNLNAVAKAAHASSQLNYSSPAAAQRLPLELKRSDEELKNRAAQEIRRMR